MGAAPAAVVHGMQTCVAELAGAIFRSGGAAAAQSLYTLVSETRV